jgi:tetratricopeptide (TPR) repeat protein
MLSHHHYIITARVELLVQCADTKRSADEAFASGNIQGACDLYSRVLALDPAFVSCISNRAGCHLALQRPLLCVQDCSAALALFSAVSGTSVTGKTVTGVTVSGPIPPPGSAKRAAWVLRTLVRRGAALVQLGQLAEAATDYADAVQLAPQDESLKSDLAQIQAQLALQQKQQQQQQQCAEPLSTTPAAVAAAAAVVEAGTAVQCGG